MQNHTHKLTNGTAKVTTSIDAVKKSNANRGTAVGSTINADEYGTATSTISGRTDGPSNNTTTTGSNCGDESRPDNFTIKIWKRIN